MSFLTSMKNRYTTKKYDRSKKIDQQKINDLKDILQLSPSSINSQPWKFMFVSDLETKKKLSNVSWLNTEKVLDCDTIVVFSRVDNLDIFEKHLEENTYKRAVDYYKEFIKPLPEEQIKAWFDRQVYLALGVFLSACAEMHIDSTPMEGIEPEHYDRILNLTDYTTLVAVAIGYRDTNDFNQPSKKPKSRVNHSVIIQSI